MKSFLQKTENAQECVRYLKRQTILSFAMLIIGITMIIFAAIANNHFPEINMSFCFIYVGFGGGMIVASIKRILYNVRICKDEKALKEYWVRIFDERENFISNRAFRMAVLIVIMITYLVALIGSVFVPYIMYVLGGQVVVLLISYTIFKSIYNKRM